MFGRKKYESCQRCGIVFKHADEEYKGFCFSCYHDYLLEKIENYRQELKNQKPKIEEIPQKTNKFSDFFQKFKKKQKK